MDLSIGQMAHLSDLPVKTIRYHSEMGIVPEASRTPAGCRPYDGAGPARLELVRALRDLGLDLAAIKQVMNRRQALAEVARSHADAIDASIHQLTLAAGGAPRARS